MKVITYSSMKDFIDDTLELLLKDEAVNQLLIFTALSKKDLATNDTLHVGKVIDENNEVSLIFLNNQPYNLLAYTPNETINVDAVKLLAKYLVNNNIRIYGINACKTISETFIRYYKKLTKANFTERLAMDIMELSEVNDITLPEGNFRQATLEDLPLLSKWFCQFSLDATNELIDISIASSFMKDKISHGLVYIFENKNKQAVSMAAATRQLQNGICINLVYTDEAFRKKKYGSAVVFNLSKLLLQSGNKFCTLCVDKSNQISNRIYRKIGYKILDNSYDFRLN